MKYLLTILSDEDEVLMTVETPNSEYLEAHIGSFERSPIYREMKEKEQKENTLKPMPF